MPETIPSINVARGLLSSAHRWHPDEVPHRKRDLEVSKLAAYIERVVQAAPPMTEEQARHLARLLKPVASTSQPSRLAA